MLKIAGIGTRELLQEDIKKIKCLSFLNGECLLRSGGAPGADTVFEEVIGENKQIFLPSRRFNYRRPDYRQGVYDSSAWFNERTWQLVLDHHPNPKALKYEATKALMQRNGFQVLGAQLNNPVDIVICVASGTKLDHNGKIQNVNGGTGQAVRIAHHNGIPIVNLRDGLGINTLPQHFQWIFTQYFYNLRNYKE